MTALKYMNAIFFVYLIKTMFGVPSSCKKCWEMSFIYFRPNYESLFILVTVENNLKMSLYMHTITLGKDSDL